MRHLSGRTAWGVLGFSVLALIPLGFAASHVTARYADSERRVAHTRAVETQVARVRSDLASAESAQFGFLLNGDPTRLEQNAITVAKLGEELQQLTDLTTDNERQVERLGRFKPLIDRKLGLMQQSIALRQTGKPDEPQQKELLEAGSDLTIQSVDLLGDMRNEEEQLLQTREVLSDRAFGRLRLILGLAFLSVVVLFGATASGILTEVKERRAAEAAVRRLSSRILELQDVERRKVARDLHDSIGQYFSGLAMNLAVLSGQDASLTAEKRQALLVQSLDLVQQGIAESRTLSHLLHPPLLDEIGFTSAANWYVEGFQQRSAIKVSLEVSPDLGRMPRRSNWYCSECCRRVSRTFTNMRHATLRLCASVKFPDGCCWE